MTQTGYSNKASRQRRTLLLPLCLGIGVILAGCNPMASRFAARMLERADDPIEPVKQRVAHPIRPDVGLSVLWVGHATVLIQIHDKVFITDPVFTRTVGMFARRAIEPGLDPASITKLDYTLISHIHMDHLSYGSLPLLPKNGKLLIPFGAAAYTPEFGFTETREMKPWDVVEEDGVRITAIPVKHFSGRYGFDVSWYPDRGYTGYVLQYNGVTVFFGGDTAYDPELFKEIGRRFRIDVALLPISPIEPRSFMRRVHADPSDAVQIFEDLKASVMIPIHYKTFFQGLEPDPLYPQQLLEKIIEEKGYQDRIKMLDIGEQRILIP
jgi:N-acyl-phosphatidylethanolamine-hydrolysing phospholipase D